MLGVEVAWEMSRGPQRTVTDVLVALLQGLAASAGTTAVAMQARPHNVVVHPPTADTCSTAVRLAVRLACGDSPRRDVRPVSVCGFEEEATSDVTPHC